MTSPAPRLPGSPAPRSRGLGPRFDQPQGHADGGVEAVGADALEERLGQKRLRQLEAGTPDALSVPAAAVRSSQVAGGSTPASEKAVTLYQTVDLLAALKRRP